MALIPILSLALIEEEERRTIRNKIKRPKRVRAFDLSEDEFVRLYKVNKEICVELVERLRPALEPRSCCSNVLSVETKVLCALRLYAGGSFQKCVANDILNRMSQQSVSNCIRKVTEAINNLILDEIVQFPVLESDRNTMKEEFFDCSGLPGVIGAIDCTHVAIVAPPDNGEHNETNYVNQKGYHSINVQLVCDIRTRILSVSARFPGCTDDGYIWKMSSLRNWFQMNSAALENSWLLGDSAYPLEPWLMTPSDRSSLPEERYDVAHREGHGVVQKCSGLLKSRFRCLLKHQPLNYSPAFTGSIINACVVLHNMCVSKGLQLTDDEIVMDELFDTGLSYPATEHAKNIRQRLINLFDF